MTSSDEEQPSSGAAADADEHQRTHLSVDEGSPVVDRMSLEADPVCHDDELEGNYDTDEEDVDVHGVIEGEMEGLEGGPFKLAERTSQIMNSYQDYITEIDAELVKGGDVEFGIGNSLPSHHVPFSETGSADTEGVKNTGFYRDFGHVDDSDLHSFAITNLHDLPSSDEMGEHSFLTPMRSSRFRFMRSKRFKGFFCGALVGFTVLILGVNVPNKKKNGAGENTKTELQQSGKSATEEDEGAMTGELGGVVVQYPDRPPLNLLDDKEQKYREYGEMLELYQPKFFDRTHWQGGTYDEALIFCATTESMAICPYEVVCPFGVHGVPASVITVDAEQAFAPVLTENVSGEWVHIGSQNGCVKADVSELVQSLEHVACCLPKVADEQALPDVGGDGATDFGDEDLVDNEGNDLTANANDLSISGDTASLAENAEQQVIGEEGPYFNVQNKYNPIWFGGTDDDTEMLDMESHAWVGGSYDDAKNFCSNNFRDGLSLELCPFEAICPQGTMNRPYGGMKSSSFEHIWAPVSNDNNIWVSVGPDDPCMFYSSLNKANPEFPTESAADGYSTQVLCCDASEEALSIVGTLTASSAVDSEPTEEQSLESPDSPVDLEPSVEKMDLPGNPIWFDQDILSAYTSLSYTEVKDICLEYGLTLCSYKVLCPGGIDQPPFGGKPKNGPMRAVSYAPVMDSMNEWINEWISVGSTNTCISWSNMNSGPPEWDYLGSEETSQYVFDIPCCPDGDVGTESITGDAVVESADDEDGDMQTETGLISTVSPASVEATTTLPATEGTPSKPVTDSSEPRPSLWWYDTSSSGCVFSSDYSANMLENHSINSPFLFDSEAHCCAIFLCVGFAIQDATPQVVEKPVYWYDNPLSPSVCDHSSDYPAYMLNENSTRTPYLFDSEDLCTKHASERLNFDITTPASTTTPSKCKWHMSAANFNYVCTNTDTVDETKINPDHVFDSSDECCSYRYPLNCTVVSSPFFSFSFDGDEDIVESIKTPYNGEENTVGDMHLSTVVDSFEPGQSLWWYDTSARGCIYSPDYSSYMVENNSIDEPFLFYSEAQCCANFLCVTVSDALPPCRWHVSADELHACTNSDSDDQAKFHQTQFFSSSDECCHFLQPLECIVKYHGGCIETATTPSESESNNH